LQSQLRRASRARRDTERALPCGRLARAVRLWLYSAKPGAGASVAQTLHRSDETLIAPEIEAAGFKLIDRGDFLRVPGDAREAHSHGGAAPVDIFLLKFRKPG
jgi:predicted methyltransferase